MDHVPSAKRQQREAQEEARGMLQNFGRMAAFGLLQQG